MNKKLQSALTDVANMNGLQLDTQTGRLFGRRGEYEICISPSANNVYVLSASVSRNGQAADLAEVKQFAKQSKVLGNCTLVTYRLNFYIKSGMTLNKTKENLQEAINAVTYYLSSNGYVNCCQSCGVQTETEACVVSGVDMLLCPACFANVSNSVAIQQTEKEQKKENVIGGVAGAFLGSLIGVLAIVILSQLGYVAALSGILMAVCSLKGYELLAGKLSKKGVVITVIVMIIMVAVGNRIDWAITAASYFGVGFATAFQYIPALIEEGSIEASTYYTNLVVVYLFVLLGAVPTIYNTMNSHKQKGTSFKLNKRN